VLNAEEYRAVFETAPDGIMVVSGDGVVRDLNPAVEGLFGYAREEVLGEPVEMLLPRAFREAHVEHRRRYQRNPHARPMGAGMELVARRKDGGEFPVEVSLSPWAHDGHDCVICMVRDVTERKRMRDFSEGALRSVEVKTAWPFPDKLVRKALAGAKRIVVMEMNLGMLHREVERVIRQPKIKIELFSKIGGIYPQPQEFLRFLEEKR